MSNDIRRPNDSDAAPEAGPAVPAWLDRINEIVFRCDAHGRVFFVNSAWTRTMEFSADETLGHAISDFVHQKDRDVHRVRLQSVLDGRRLSLQHEARFVARDGSDRWLELRALAEQGEHGAVAGLTGTLTDVTSRRKMADELRALAYEAEEARADAESAAQLLRATAEDITRERDQAVASGRATAEFIASMAQDLHAPLNGVQSAIEKLLHGDLSGEQRTRAENVRGSAESLAGLVNDIAEFARAAAGTIEVRDEDFDVHELVDDLSRLLVQKALSQGITFGATVSPNVPERLRGDATHIRQVLMNLASNAVRAADEGSVNVIISRSTRTRPDGRLPVRVEVHASGTAFNHDEIARMFELGAAGSSLEGAGLGLVIARRLVDMMGGTLEFGGEPGEGNWVVVELPLARAAAAAPPAALSHNAAPLHLRVLLAEDNVVNQKVVTRILERWGVQVTVVGDGAAAVDAAREDGWDLVLMDVRMPRLDGLQAAEEIRSHEAAQGRQRLPIVAMTANALSGDRERCNEAGMDGFVAKPIRPADLYAELSRWAGHIASDERRRAA